MDILKIYAQYQKYIAITERVRLQAVPAAIPAGEPVLSGPIPSTGSLDALPTPDQLEPAGERPEIWRRIDAQEAVTRLRSVRN
jgi:hypothetical protein